jgi:hypothetical protein
MALNWMPPNGLGITRAAPIDRDDGRIESSFQNRHDLGATKRRRVHARVGPRPWGDKALHLRLLYSPEAGAAIEIWH